MAKSLGEEKVRHIPQDLASLVLSKLPLKSLKRFECAHKTWSLLFENHVFITMFRDNFTSISHSYYDDTSLIIQQLVHKGRSTVSILHLLSSQSFENRLKLDLPTPLQTEHPMFYILYSSTINGTLCLSKGDKTFVLWNPTTDEVNVIPPSPRDSVSPDSAMISFHGFGYNRVRDDYTIIKCLNNPKAWEIYSLRCNTWKKLDVNMPSRSYYRDLLNTNDGICHWLSETDDQLCLVSFDLSSYVFLTTSTPIIMNQIDFEDPNDYGMMALLVMLNGSIALISCYVGKTTFDILILGELGVSESWTKLFTIGPLPSYIEEPIGVGKNGDIFFEKINDGKLVCYDLSTHMFEEISLEEPPSNRITYKKKWFIELDHTLVGFLVFN
ncbi:putative galactose oxidase/kelch, beta-propeller, F-box associated interaction [Medicago truncatula]|uniref:F-box protein interaction domain protein n=1 Tax=Medicago truncatula TaxID=3880 RepID=G7KQM7_MEDTR|nr:F-box/kelch-repeat protein At3g23880 [Medicago truncatula]AES80355.2 F-box protein interaction domain protein [Medicago truncatula]RHN47085.1 putative galactose oxidase/kelch, beta-propeller, F-box associated interaction [Medicago truncatula]